MPMTIRRSRARSRSREEVAGRMRQRDSIAEIRVCTARLRSRASRHRSVSASAARTSPRRVAPVRLAASVGARSSLRSRSRCTASFGVQVLAGWFPGEQMVRAQRRAERASFSPSSRRRNGRCTAGAAEQSRDVAKLLMWLCRLFRSGGSRRCKDEGRSTPFLRSVHAAWRAARTRASSPVRKSASVAAVDSSPLRNIPTWASGLVILSRSQATPSLPACGRAHRAVNRWPCRPFSARRISARTPAGAIFARHAARSDSGHRSKSAVIRSTARVISSPFGCRATSALARRMASAEDTATVFSQAAKVCPR